MTPLPTPPSLAERVLFATVPDGDWRESIVGDLREEFAVLSQRRGPRAARRWYWRQALTIGSRAVVSRLRANPVPQRNWVSVPDLDERARWSAGLTRDLSYALRSVLRRPGTSAVIVLTLALSIAANATIFGIMDAIVWRPFRFPAVNRAVVIASSTPRDPNVLLGSQTVAPADYVDWRREVTRLRDLSAAEWWDANLSGIDTPEQVAGFKVTADFFRALGAEPVLGRGFFREEETRGQHRRVVLGHALWTRRFGSDPTVIGRAIRVDGEPYEVVGVAPPGFRVPQGAEMWAPLANTQQTWNDRIGQYLYVIGRLTDGATVNDAGSEVSAIVLRQQHEYPDTNAKRSVRVVDFTRGMADPGAGPFVSTWLVASLLLLLVACANVANLLLAQGTERSQEFAVRLALGAGRGRLATQLLLEGAALSIVAAVLAIPLAWLGLALSRASIPGSVVRFVPGWPYMGVSAEMLAATAALAVFATLLFSLMPALQAARAGVSEALRQGARSVTARRRQWTRTTLAAVQVALTLALLFGSVLVLSAAREAMTGAVGFDRQHVLTARLVLPSGPYAALDARLRFVNTVLDRMRAIPAVSAAAVVSHLPYGGSNQSREFRPEGTNLSPADVRRIDFRTATPGYFETMKIPRLAGRSIVETDTRDALPVAVVSKSLADRYWPNQDPIGRRFQLEAGSAFITVVGVSGDIVHDWFRMQRNQTVYRPAAQAQIRPLAIVARIVGDPMSIAGDLRRAVAAADPDQPIIELKSMEDVIHDRVAGIAFVARALAVIALVAFVLAVTGLYSLMAYFASRRTREIGVRIALGARRWQVITLTTGQAFRITVGGVAVGVALSVAIGRVMESVLLGIVSSSWTQLAGLAVILTSVTLIAAYLPARRVARVDPSLALRAE